MNNAALSTTSDVATFQLSIGSRRWPERPSDSVGEQWLRLREAAGVAYGESEISILPTDFCNRKSITAWDLEEVGHQGASHSGLSTKNGDIMTIDVKIQVLVHLVIMRSYTWFLRICSHCATDPWMSTRGHVILDDSQVRLRTSGTAQRFTELFALKADSSTVSLGLGNGPLLAK